MAQAAERTHSYKLATETELDEALAYLSAHPQHTHAKVDRLMLRTLFAAVTAHRLPGSKLALLTATVVRTHVPPKDKGNVRIVEAYTSGVMKIFNIRATHARKRASRPTTVSPATVHPAEANGQLILL